MRLMKPEWHIPARPKRSSRSWTAVWRAADLGDLGDVAGKDGAQQQHHSWTPTFHSRTQLAFGEVNRSNIGNTLN